MRLLIEPSVGGSRRRFDGTNPASRTPGNYGSSGDRWGNVLVILRVFDHSLGHRLEETFEFRHVWSTAAIAAPWFVGAAIGMGVITTFYIGSQPFLVARLTVREGGGLAGAEMRELRANVRVMAIQRDDGKGLEYPPRRDTRLAAGDEAYLAGPYEELMQILRIDQAPANAGGE